MTANVPWEIYQACAAGEQVDASVYVQLHTTLDIDGLWDLIEMRRVHASWGDAAYKNAKHTAERERQSQPRTVR